MSISSTICTFLKFGTTFETSDLSLDPFLVRIFSFFRPPYNTNSGSTQKIGPISLEKIAGVHHEVDPPQDFVLGPLSTQVGSPGVQAALAKFNAASPAQQARWEAAYEKAVANATVGENGELQVPAGDYGPVGTMIAGLTNMARSGALDTAMLNGGAFYTSNYTRSLLFLSDGGYLANQGATHHLAGDQWGMMNETGQWPGQAWLWLYTLWYQIPPANSSPNGDIQVFAFMIGLTLLLALVPFIPGLRSIPRWTRIYRLIWRNHYREVEGGSSGGPPSGSPPPVESAAPEPVSV